MGTENALIPKCNKSINSNILRIESSWRHGFYQKWPKCSVIFWAKVKSNNFHVKLLKLLFGQLFNLASGHSYYV